MKNNFNIAFIRFALLLVTLFQSLNVVQAQTYPVQVNVNTAGPYYNYLSYYADENFHLQAVVTLTDFNSAPVQARLRLKIEGPGYTAITKPGVVVGSTFTLSPGMPEFVKGIDLAPYFYENNLLVTPSGINLNNLPEGFTTICVEVINDSPAQEVLSTNNCTSFFLQRFQPSQLVFPACGSSVNPSEQFHTFQWTPPVGFVPSIGTEINYTFSLYEWNDPNNYNIFQTGQGLVYTTQTSNPLVQLSSFDITFQEGLTYVWRIEAQILSNGLEVNMLENNGVSSPCTFVYGEVQSLEESLADGLTIDLNTSSEGERKGRAYWTVIDNTPGEGLSTFSSFVVAYRKQPTGNEEFDLTWFEDTVSSFSQFIYQLEPSTTYEVKIAGIAGDFVSDYSEVETFTTNAPRNYACGDQDLPFRPANYTPLENALVGMVFQIGQFDMTITQITPTGSAGHYSGKGMIPVAFLGGARAKVRFDDILVDDQYLVREGQVDVVTKGVENWLSEEYLSMVDPIDVQGQITAYGFANDSTVWAVVNGDTLTWTFQNDLPIVIHGEGNVEIQYWPDGHIVVTTYGSIPSTDSLSATASLNIQFEEVVGQESYFDKKEHDHFAENYEAITCAGNYVYWVPNASRRKPESRQVKAVFHGYDEILDVSKVKFEMNGGYTIAQHTVLNDSTYLVTLPIKDFDYQLYAKYDTLKMGKLNVKSFAQVTKNIKIVPLVPLNYSSTDVSQSLTNLYQGAHVNCVVSIDSLFNTSEFNSSTVFANPEVNGMLHYTEQMRNLREAYFLNHELESDTYLVFVINEFEDASVDGYMVRGKGLGFVTQSSLTTLETFTHTLGHELGHGIGGLVHAWGDAASKKNTTDNLMDYSGGTTLTNNQWQALHNSENVFSLLDSEEDAEFFAINGNINEMLSSLANTDGSFTFISPSGKPITLKGQISNVTFATFEDRWLINGDADENSYAPIGCLVSFVIDNIYFNAYRKSGTQIFIGYSNDSVPYKDSLSRFLSVNPIMAIPTYQKSGFYTTAFKISNPPLYNPLDTIVAAPILNTWDLVAKIAGTDLENKVILPAEFSANFSLSTLSLLNDLLFTNYTELNETVYEFYGYEAVAIYNAAYYIENFPNAQSCYMNFNEITKVLTTKQLKGSYTSAALQTEIDNRNEQLLFNQSLSIYQDGIQPLTILPPLIYGEIEFYTLVGQQEYQRKRLATALSGIRFYNNLISEFSELSDLSEIDFKVLIQLSKILDSVPGLGDCLFLNISPESKIKLLNRITEWTSNDGKEEFLLRILENTTDEQFAIMYPLLFSNNCALLHNLDKGFWFSHYDRFANRITQLLLNYKKSNLNSYSNIPILPLYHDGINPFDSEVECDFSECTMDFDAQIVGLNNIERTFHPSDLVRFTIEDNFQFNGFNGNILNVGDTLLAPAFWGYYFLKEHDQHTNWQVFKYFAEAVLILATSGTAAPEIIEVELEILGADIVVKSLQDEYPNNPTLTGLSYSLDALSLLIPITGGHAIVKNGITRLPWISKIVGGTSNKILFYKDEFTLFLRALKSENKTLEAAQYLEDIFNAIQSSNLVIGAKQTLLNYLTVAHLELNMIKYTPDPYKARLVLTGHNTNFFQVEIYQSAGNYAAGSRVNMGNFSFDNQIGDFVFSNLSEYTSTYGNITKEITLLNGLKVLENGTVTSKTYRLVMTESGNLCLKVVSTAGSLAQSLSGFLKSSYDELITKGFTTVEEAGKIKFLDNVGRHLAEISNGQLIFKYGGFGGDVVITEGKTTTVLGKFAEDLSNPSSYGTRRFLGSNGNPVVQGFPNGSINRGIGSAVPNRMNFLDLPESQYNALINGEIKAELETILGSSSNINFSSKSVDEVKALIQSSYPSLSANQIDNIVSSGVTKGNNEFWTNYNLPFLEQAFQRGDDIRLVSDPSVYQSNAALGGTYKKELDAIMGSNGLAQQYGYTYNSTTKTFIKQ